MAYVTDLGFTMLELGAAKDAGEVRSQVHPEFPMLEIFNYGEEVQYKNRWNKITLACRGLILNTVTGEVVARPWEKFFNFGQMDNRIESNAPVEVTDKLDGSLGILYERPDGEWAIATRGSFASEQAIEANKIWNESYAHLDVPEDCTFLFEILVPWNRIVVSYDYDSEYLQQGRGVLPQRTARNDTGEHLYTPGNLVLLGAVNKQYGYYYGPSEASGMLNWSGPVAEVFHAKDFVSAISLPDRKGKEGYIIRSGNKIVKLKQADYVELHRIVTSLSPKTVWQMLGDGKTVDQICEGIPDEFYDYVDNIARELQFRASAIVFDTAIEFFQASTEALEKKDENNQIPRRAWAEAIKKKTNPGLLFAKLDGKDIRPMVWNMVKPRGDVKSLVEDNG